MESSRRIAALGPAMILLVAFALFVHGADGEGTPKSRAAAEATYTPKEVAALEKFRKSLRGNEELTQPYMRRDEYLIRWLRARDLDVGEAKAMLLKNLRWRKAEKIDGLVTEKFPAFEREFPYDIQSVDKEGRPVLIVNFAKWDLRKIALSGQLSRVLRYLNKIDFEEPSAKAREAGQATGSNSTQYYVLVDMAGFNLRQHACGRCLPTFLWYIETYENYYPQLVKETIFLNTPQIFDVIINLTKPLWSKHLTDHLMFLGYEKSEWRRRIGKFIALDQLPVRFGGTNPRPV